MTDVFDPTGSIETSYNLTVDNQSLNTTYSGLPLSNIIANLAASLQASTPSGVNLSTNSPTDWAYLILKAGLANTIDTGTLNSNGDTNPSSVSTLQAFLTNIVAAGAQSANGITLTAQQQTNLENAIYQGMLQDYTDATGVTITNDQSVVPPGNYSDFTNPSNPFVQAFNSFLGTVQYSVNGNAANDFLNQFQDFLLGPSTSSSGPIITLSTYASYYFNNTLNGTPSGYISFLNNFIQNEISTNGYFLPGASFQDFQNQVQSSSNSVQTLLNANKNSSVVGTDSGKAQIINRVLALTISVINALQNIGIAQANNLTYLTGYQNAYTTLLQELPTFLVGSGSPIGVSISVHGGTTASNDRNDINSSLNGNFTTNLQSLRSIASNTAQTVQSNINTTNGAVNQQTDVASTFLQEISKLLGVIFH